MSNSIIIVPPDTELELELVKEFERMINEGNIVQPKYNCKNGFHKMLWYHGFREKYHYCDLCDHKDYTMRPRS